ncbi:MAG: DUF4926 domain-containing protein, partial [Verrucomicrobiales bacterium]|nr:DUF4926 domain-containing protein [Verrucomicrobiales bacterium]MDP4790344.1 DUF4926 domain-containing protein [Verrucomicrobiales bacterium]
MNQSLDLLEVIALTEDLPEAGLFAGQVGTVVEKLADGVFEIEFCDDQGRTYAELAAPEKTLMRLRYAPVVA